MKLRKIWRKIQFSDTDQKDESIINIRSKRRKILSFKDVNGLLNLLFLEQSVNYQSLNTSDIL